ncbi:MAG: O-antigen ligase family protein [Rhodospirillaceae bacterium]
MVHAVSIWRQPSISFVEPRRIAWSIAGMAVVMAWIVIQTVPWLPSTMQNPLYPLAAEALGYPIAGRIAIDAELALTALLRLLTYCAVFWIAFQSGRETENARKLYYWIVCGASFYALYGLFSETISGSCDVLGLRKLPIGRTDCLLSSTFVNSNSYATYAGLCILVGLSILISAFHHENQERYGNSATFRTLLKICGTRHGLVLVVIALVLTTLLISGSRGGIASTLIGVFILFHLMVARKLKYPSGFFGVYSGVFIVMISMAALFGRHIFDKTTGMEHQINDRVGLLEIAIKAIASEPWLGWGFGSFEWQFAVFQEPWQMVYQNKAHCTILEMVADLGIPVATILFLAVALVIRRTFIGATTRQRDSCYSAVAAAASVLVLLHGFVDFSLQIPGVAVLYAALLGTGCAQSWSSRNKPPGAAVNVPLPALL